MREILFRAKHYRTKQWVYGIPLKNPLRGSEDAYYPQIIPEVHGVHSTINSCSIIEETIGQFTGLTDKNGVKIFEGDIVEYETGKKVRIGRVFFSDFRSSFSVTAGKNGSARINNDLYNYIQNRNSVIVIGNIYDNPELIGGNKNG